MSLDPRPAPNRSSPRARALASLSTNTGASNLRPTNPATSNLPHLHSESPGGSNTELGSLGGSNTGPFEARIGAGSVTPTPRLFSAASGASRRSCSKTASTCSAVASGPSNILEGFSTHACTEAVRSVTTAVTVRGPMSKPTALRACGTSSTSTGGLPPVEGPSPTSRTSPSLANSAIISTTVTGLNPAARARAPLETGPSVRTNSSTTARLCCLRSFVTFPVAPLRRCPTSIFDAFPQTHLIHDVSKAASTKPTVADSIGQITPQNLLLPATFQ